MTVITVKSKLCQILTAFVPSLLALLLLLDHRLPTSRHIDFNHAKQCTHNTYAISRPSCSVNNARQPLKRAQQS
jgi:hypothetical protein